MNNRKRGYLIGLLILFTLTISCTPTEKRLINDAAKNAVAQAEHIAQTETSNLKKTAEAKFATLASAAKTEVPNVFATLVSQQQSTVFKPPSYGYIGLKYKELYPDGNKHSGIDIWASKQAKNGGNRGNPVYAVFGGKLGRTGSGVEICHPQLEAWRYPDLPFYLVCTYYGHLTDLPQEFSSLRKDSCPNNLIQVEQGDLLGYMDNLDMKGNNGIVHLHFSVVQQNPQNGCWTNEQVLANTIDPFLYLGLKSKDYGWLEEFP